MVKYFKILESYHSTSNLNPSYLKSRLVLPTKTVLVTIFLTFIQKLQVEKYKFKVIGSAKVNAAFTSEPAQNVS